MRGTATRGTRTAAHPAAVQCDAVLVLAQEQNNEADEERRTERGQLGFPWRRDSLDQVLITELSGDGRMQVEVRASAHEIAVHLQLLSRVGVITSDDSQFHREQFTIELRVAAPVRCLVNGQPSSWNMTSSCDEQSGPFADAIAWALEQLDPEWNEFCWDELLNVRYAAHRAELAHVCRIAASRAVDMCADDARVTAMQFNDAMRMFLYAALLEYDSERVMQMLDICPGLFILAAVTPNIDIARGVHEGRSLPQLLRAAISSTTERVNIATLLVRRAPAVLSPAWLLGAILAEGIDINDMPSTRANLWIWYRWMFDFHRAAGRIQDANHRARFGGFVSKHAIELEAISDGREMDGHATLNEILDYIVLGLGSTPSRRSSPARVVELLDAWHDTLWNKSDLKLDAELPRAPTPQAVVEGVVSIALTTVGELVEEGRKMRHCVGAYARVAADGNAFFYRATVHEQRVTIAVTRTGDRWRLMQAAGFANHPVVASEALQAWVDTLALAGENEQRV